MAQETNTRQLGLFLVIGMGFLFAWFAGNSIADENFYPIAAVLGGLVGLIVVFGFGKSIYLLIPVCWGLTGKISVLPLPFDVRQLVVLMATLLILSDVIFKRRIRKQRYRLIDGLVFLNIGYLAVIFFLHPVGVAALGGGDRVGGRPYLDILLGLIAYTILSREKPSLNYFKKLPYYCLCAACFAGFAGAVGRFLPGVGGKLAYFYSDFAPGMMMDGIVVGAVNGTDFGEDRMTFLLYPGTILCLYIASLVNPAELIRPANWRVGIVYLSGIIMVMFSGFRDGLINIIMTTAAASILRERVVGFAKILAGIVVLGLTGVVLSYTDFKLPFTFQRSLSFLPGNWDIDAIASAKESSEWRVEMWKEVIRSDKYIQNKIFGDGFGISRVEYENQLADTMSGGGNYGRGDLAAQEAFMVNGDFHNGPLTTVRCMGLVGLVLLFLPLLIATGFYAYRMIIKSAGTPFQTCALFFGIGAMTTPIFFLFVFGDFKSDIVNALFCIGMINMIRGSLEDYMASRATVGDRKISDTLPVMIQNPL